MRYASSLKRDIAPFKKMRLLLKKGIFLLKKDVPFDSTTLQTRVGLPLVGVLRDA